LRRILRSFARYYNEARTHRSLEKDAPHFRGSGPFDQKRFSGDFITTMPESSFRNTQPAALSAARGAAVWRG
jgi:hypothetical protein